MGRVAVMALVLAIAWAIWIQDHTDALPLGLFNDGRETYALLSAGCLMLALAVVAVFSWELFRGQPGSLAGFLRASLFSLLFVELMLTGIDVSLVSRGDDPPLGGPYRELQAASGDWIFVKKPHAGSTLGFRHAEVAKRETDLPRILFLGDSYTEGSGRAFACNLPEAATMMLAAQIGRPVDVFNAGVAGYGPQDAARLFSHLLGEGYRFDAVVLSLFLENDFTDNLPATTRRVVAGINFRFPEANWLRVLHPLNSRAFRYGLFLDRASRIVRSSGAPARRDTGTCQLEADPQQEFPDDLLRLAGRRVEANYGTDARVAWRPVELALAEIQATAAASGIQAFLAVLPDRVLVDGDLAERLELDVSTFPVDAHLTRLAGTWPELIDLRPALREGSENYRPEDTHLSDLGNLRVGEALGSALARRLGGRWGFRADPSSTPRSAAPSTGLDPSPGSP